MCCRPVVCAKLLPKLLLCLCFGTVPVVFAQQETTLATKPGALTVKRIFSDASLSGSLMRGIDWTPNSKRLSYFQENISGKAPKTELWAIDSATREHLLLLSAEKLETVLPASPRKQSQATTAPQQVSPRYHWAPGADALLLEGPHALAYVELKNQTARVLVSGKEDLSDAKISPDGKYVSFVRAHNLWLVSITDGKERALTTRGSEEVRKGELDWVYSKEFGISTGYWWAPDSSAIAYLEMDERKVPQFPLVDFESFTGETELQRYPVPGSANPVVRVLVAGVAGGEERPMDLGMETDIYIPRLNWLPDSKHIAIQRLNRTQTILDLLLADTTTGKSATLLSDKDAYWINVGNDLHFLKNGKCFLWSSERSGYRHLYLYDLSGKEVSQLTKGDWEVSHVDAVDEVKGLVYFTATEKSPLERHLYRVGLDGGGFTRITTPEGTHAVNFSPDAASYMDTYSNASRPPRQDLYRADGSKLATLNENEVSDLKEYHLSQMEFFTINSHDQVPLNCSMIKPPNFDPARKYPVLVYTEGGPHEQVVVNAWGGNRFLWHQLMAQKGYIIFSLDNRGSAGRGHLFEEPIHYRFNAQELSDQLDGAQWLKSQPYVDANRIGIWGWGYGGHMTLHAMFKASQVFKVGFAGAPVTDWHFYDTVYTERYIGLLPMHEESYQESSPVENAQNLKGKLLIAHGTNDDNVHYENTLALLDELIEAGNYVEVLSFPGRGHEVSDPAALRFLWDRVTKFFLDNL
jgi:dipeptidyl-peptidase 4